MVPEGTVACKRPDLLDNLRSRPSQEIIHHAVIVTIVISVVITALSSAHGELSLRHKTRNEFTTMRQ